MSRLTPVQRDAGLFLGALAFLLLGVWASVSFGFSFGPGGAGPGLALWAVALIALTYLAVGSVAFWWYYVYADERLPARGEFTLDSENHVHHGEGSFRGKMAGLGVQDEPQYRMTTEPGFVPRTMPRWTLWVLGIVVAVALAALLSAYAQTLEDPVPPLLVAAGVLGGAVMLGALGVGEMGHEGAWTRHEGPGPRETQRDLTQERPPVS